MKIFIRISCNGVHGTFSLLLFIGNSILYTVYCILYIVYCILYINQTNLYIIVCLHLLFPPHLELDPRYHHHHHLHYYYRCWLSPFNQRTNCMFQYLYQYCQDWYVYYYLCSISIRVLEKIYDQYILFPYYHYPYYFYFYD